MKKKCGNLKSPAVPGKCWCLMGHFGIWWEMLSFFHIKTHELWKNWPASLEINKFPVLSLQRQTKHLIMDPGEEEVSWRASRFLLTGSGIAGVACGCCYLEYLWWNSVRGNLSVLCSNCLHCSSCHSSYLVPSKVLQPAVATGLLSYLRPV